MTASVAVGASVGRRRGRRGRVSAALFTATGLAVAAVMAFPFYWMAASALKPDVDIQASPPRFLPWPVTLDHFKSALDTQNLGAYLRNSLIIASATIVLAVLIALMSATAVARMHFRGRKAFLLMIMMAMMAPFEALLIPVYIMLRDANLLDRLWAMTAVYVMLVLPFTVWMLRGFIAAVPVELEEAAMIDGCSRLSAFRRVVLPLLAPGLVATSIFGFITAWNEFQFALVVLRDDNQTLPTWLSTFRTTFGTDWGGTMAAATMFTLPVVVFFMIIQRRLVSGLTAGSVKG